MTNPATSADSGEQLDAEQPAIGGTHRFTLRKREKLCSERSFDLLIKARKSCYMGALQLIYSLDHPAELVTARMMVAFTAPKRSFKRAADRNLLKRRMREAYRLHKHALLDLLTEKGKFGACLIKYNIREIRSFNAIELDMKRAIERLMRQL